ncbi:uncharacterized protein LOC142181262 [Nicotiana tabacum]|uniref:Uncharacterized protein LOC142181262 n=1 Tax=Nicotiana tabacum TaxID=4097 RepID=A0AC58ULA6_TOBAC
MITDIEAVMNAQETQGQRVQQGSTVVEENRTLKQQMTKIRQACANGQGQPCHESRFATQQEQYHYPEYHSYLFELPVNIEKSARKRVQEEITQRVKRLEQRLKNTQAMASQKSVAFRDLCMFPDVHLLPGFKVPKFEKYNGHGDPIAHLKRYCNQLRGMGRNEELLIAYFGESLSGVASEWFFDQYTSCWYVWDDMARAFVKQFQYNIDIAPDRISLSNLKKKPTESFREYAIKWREQAARAKPPMDDHELITIFIQAQEPDYFQYMTSAVGKSFPEAIKMGEMVENGLKTGRIISQRALKAAALAVQIEAGNTNEGDEEIMVISGSRRGPRRTSRRYVQPHQVSHDPLKHYYLLPNPPYFVDPSQYVAQPSNHPRKRARVSQNLHPLPQKFQLPYNPHPSQGYRKKQKLKDSFTPIGESYASLFEKLKQHDMIAPIPPNQVDRRARSFDSSKRCEYHSNAWSTMWKIVRI